MLVLTARDAVADRVKGLDAGADDYLVKPFDLDELSAGAARGRAHLRAGESRLKPTGKSGPRPDFPYNAAFDRGTALAKDHATRAVPFSAFALGLSLIAALMLLVAGPGNRFEWWDYRTAFGIMAWAAWTGVGAAAVSLIMAAWTLHRGHRRASVVAIAGVLVGVLVFSFPMIMRSRAVEIPPIHDITTDTDNPPELVAVLPRRQGLNTAVYGGPSLAAQQKKGYPDIAPLMLALPPATAFERCLDAARSLGWEIVEANPSTQRFEATDTTVFFGFKDDIVVRVTSAGAGSRVDIRSVSRVGRSDLGVNARRIRTFLARVASGA